MTDVCYQLVKWSALAFGSVVASAVKATDSLAGRGVFAFLENASTRELLISERAPHRDRRNFCFYSKQKFSGLGAEAMLRIGLIR